MMLPIGALPALVVGSRTNAAGLHQHTLPAGHDDKSFRAPVPTLARREKPVTPAPAVPMICVPETVSGWPDCARVIPLNDQPPNASPKNPCWLRKNGS